MDELMLKVANVSKEYRLGAIGGTTLKEELQRLSAKIRKKEDPTRKIGQENVNIGERFNALTDVSFEVKKGEAVGIIGHNGAGKSTLLKLITRITAPTEGKIYLNGRVASMLEVGTGFHPELTGRENIYVNGAILGMTKKEIDAKIEDIIEFSEVRQFIDTPVKRYSSGMYVKLAFSVAAHLDSEIMIMDEVLAVGDVAFQNKCIQKMKEVAESGRTVLYVSHNMATIRSLCTRCMVLEKGKLIFDGGVEEAITHYVSVNKMMAQSIDLSGLIRPYRTSQKTHMTYFSFADREKGVFTMGDKLRFRLDWTSESEFEQMRLRIGIFTSGQIAAAIAFSQPFHCSKGGNTQDIILDISSLLPGKYYLELIMNEISDDGVWFKHDVIDRDVIEFEVTVSENKPIYHMANNTWGFVELPEAVVVDS